MNSYFVVLCLIHIRQKLYCYSMKNKSKFLFTTTLHLPVIQRQHIYQCLIKKQPIGLQQNKSFLNIFNDCYSYFMKWVVNNTVYYESMKGYYYNSETYLFGSPEQIKASQSYLTMAGWNLFLFLYKDKFVLHKKKHNTYLASLTKILLSQLTSHPEYIPYIQRDFVEFYNPGQSIETLVFLLIKKFYDFDLDKLWYRIKKVNIPLDCSLEKRAWFFDLVTRYFYTLIVLTDRSDEEIVIRHNYCFMSEYLFGYKFWWDLHGWVTLKVRKVISVRIYGGAQSQPLLSHGMPLPADLIVRNDGEHFLNSAEIELLNEFLV